MSYSTKANQKEHIFICSQCKNEISEKEDEWISSYPRCPKCNKNTMKAKEEGKISNYVDYGESNSISIGHINFGSDYFYSDTKEIKFNAIENSLCVILNTKKIIKHIRERINKKCDVLNTEFPKKITINLDR